MEAERKKKLKNEMPSSTVSETRPSTESFKELRKKGDRKGLFQSTKSVIQT